MSKTVGHWANLPSNACFVYLARESPEACRAMIAALVDGLGLAPDELKISTKDHQLQWSKFAWAKVDAAIAKPALSIALFVGTPQEVHLGGQLAIGWDPRFARENADPLRCWFAAEATRWPTPQFVGAARNALRAAATHGDVLSGGVLAAANLRDAKVEASLEYEGVHGEPPTRFAEQIRTERHVFHAWDKLRRVYPVTLLGPRFAAKTSEAQLRDAGALAVERVGDALLVDAAPDVVEAWSPAYLAETQRLRALVWPWSFQHPLDDPKRKLRT